MRARWFGRDVARRLPGLLLGLAGCGFGVAFMARSDLGLGPWEAFHQGIGRQIGVPLGTVSVLVGVPVLLAWLPLRQAPGIGTILNLLTVGLATNIGLALIPEGTALPVQMVLLVAGIGIFGVGSGLYLAADLGPGPRDGLMTGLHGRLGWSIVRARTLLEVSVLVVGFLLGGTIGLGTILFALGIGPLIQLSLRIFDPEGRVLQRRGVDGEPLSVECAA